MYLPPINSSPRLSSQKSSFGISTQRSKFAKGSIDLNLPTQSDSPKFSTIQTPSTRRMSCASPLSSFDPAKSSLKGASPDSTLSTLSNISLTATRRNSALSFKCLESLNKNRRFSIQIVPPSQFAEFHSPIASITMEQNKEECELIHSSTQKDAEKLNSIVSLEKRDSHIQAIKDSERAFKIADQVLTAYGIHARVYTDHSSDSAMTLLPITDKRRVANFYRLFIPEMRRFNYTFLSNLRVGAISICESLKFSTDKYTNIIEKKLYSGLFVLDRHVESKNVQQHWFRIVLFHFLKAVPEFFEEWKQLIKEDPKKERKSAFEELLVTFNHLMGTSQKEWQQDIYLKARVNFLNEALREFDFDPKESNEDEEGVPELLKLLALIN